MRSLLCHFICLWWGVLALASCGNILKPSTSEPKYIAEQDLSDRFRDPDMRPYVEPGSKKVIVSPDAGELPGVTMVRLFTENEGRIYFDLQPFTNKGFAREYKEPLLLFPPFTIWAQAEVDGSLGEIFQFTFTSSDKGQFATPLSSQKNRLLEIKPHIVNAAQPQNIGKKLSLTSALKNIASAKTDGVCNEWLMPNNDSSSYVIGDAQDDVPRFVKHIDVIRAGAHLDAEFLHLMMETDHTMLSASQIAYGFAIGPSNITATSFGEGTQYKFQIEVHDNTLALYKDQNEKPEKITGSTNHVMKDRCLEIKIARADLPDTFKASNIAVRPYAIDWTRGASIRDKLLPIYLDPNFHIKQHHFTLHSQPNAVKFFAANSYKDESFIDTHLHFSQVFLESLAKLNGIPFFEISDYPFYFTKTEENGYAGLNSTDRGLLSTWGKNKSFTAIAQLVAHEFAHYQNAAYSRVNEQWLQEGMSEWSAERAMYHSLPPRAVYELFRTKRILPFLNHIAGSPSENYNLAKWTREQILTLGYERAYAFFIILDHEVGSDVLAKAFQYGYGLRMNGKQFQTFLERETGRDLSHIFRYYVYPGQVDPDYNPTALFSDDDNDGLMNIDETYLGFSSTADDSNHDGWYDGEEFFLGLDAKNTKLAQDIVTHGPEYVGVSNNVQNVPSSILRLGRGSSTPISFNLLGEGAETVRTYNGPVLAYAPYSLFGDLREDVPFLKPSGSGFLPVTIPSIANWSDMMPEDPILTASPINTEILGKLDPKIHEMFSSGYDLDHVYGSYDITSFRTYRDNKGNLHLHLKTRLPPDVAGAWGRYSFNLSNMRHSGANFDRQQWGNLEINQGEVSWSSFVAPNGEDIEKINVHFGDELHIIIPENYVSDWFNGAPSESRVICPRTYVEMTKTKQQGDTLLCMAVESPGRRFYTKFQDALGLTTHSIELNIQATEDQISDTEAEANLTFLAGLIQRYASLLKRPLLARQHWPIYIFYSGISEQQINLNLGLYLRVANDTSLSDLRFVQSAMLATQLIIEQRLLQGIATPQPALNSDAYFIFKAFRNWLHYRALFTGEPTADFSAGYQGHVNFGHTVVRKLVDTTLPLDQLWSKLTAFHSELELCNESDHLADFYGSFYNAYPTTVNDYILLLEKYGITGFFDETLETPACHNNLNGLVEKWIR